jgi:hypothetical protein
MDQGPLEHDVGTPVGQAGLDRFALTESDMGQAARLSAASRSMTGEKSTPVTAAAPRPDQAAM